MKKKYLILACIILYVVFIWIAHRAEQYVLNSIKDASIENIKDALKRQFEYCLVYNNETGVVYSAENEVQALNIFDSYIVPTLDDCSETRIKRLKARIVDGKAWIYQVVMDDMILSYLIDLFPSSTKYIEYGFNYFESGIYYLTGEFYPPCENHGILYLHPRGDHFCQQGLVSAYEEYCRQLPRLKDAIPRPGDLCLYDHDSPEDTSVIVDVADVVLLRVEGFNMQRYEPFDEKGRVGVYRIRLDVRKILRGQLNSESYILEASWPWTLFKYPRYWMFYRGMTLRISLHRENGNILLVYAKPVEPYPPYSTDIVINGGGLVGFPRINDFEWRLEPLVVEYGTHTKVEFKHGDLITAGKKASFADFGVTSKFKVLELKEGSNKEYWENAWFVHDESLDEVASVKRCETQSKSLETSNLR